MLVDRLVDPEVAVGIEAHHLLGRADLVLAERRAVRLGGVDGVRRRVADVRADGDERRALGFVPAASIASCERVEVLGVLATRWTCQPLAAKRATWFSASKEIAVVPSMVMWLSS